jgi:hypothetical protein
LEAAHWIYRPGWENRYGVFRAGALLFPGLSGSRFIVDRENLSRIMETVLVDEQTTLLFQADSATADFRRGHDC